MTLPRFMRTRSGLKAEVVAQDVIPDQSSQSSVIVLITNPNGTTSVAYRQADGTHSGGYSSLDLIEYDTDAPVRHVQLTLKPKVFDALRTLWIGGYRKQAVEAAIHSTTIDATDMRHYLMALWGE